MNFYLKELDLNMGKDVYNDLCVKTKKVFKYKYELIVKIVIEK